MRAQNDKMCNAVDRQHFVKREREKAGGRERERGGGVGGRVGETPISWGYEHRYLKSKLDHRLNLKFLSLTSNTFLFACIFSK